MNNAETLDKCEELGIEPKHFSIDANKYSYMAMQYLYFSRNQIPTPNSVIEVLTTDKSKEALEEVGSQEYLQMLQDVGETSENISIYSKKLMQAYTQREAFKISYDALEFVLGDESDSLNPNEIVESIVNKLNAIETTTTASSDVVKFGTDIAERLEERANTPNAIPGLETGYELFDRYTYGGRPGDLIFFCARSKTGKSVLLANIAKKLSVDDGLPVLYIDTEMSSEEQEDRVLSMTSQVREDEIKSGLFAIDTPYGEASAKRASLKDASEKMEQGNFHHVFMPSFTLEKVKALVHKYKREHGIVAVFFDYLKLPTSEFNSSGNVKEYQLLGNFATGLKELAGEVELPVFSAVQENRSDADGVKKGAGNVAGSDRILQLATKLCFLYNLPDTDIAKRGGRCNQELYIAFQRNGQSDCPPIEINFDRPRLTMKEA